MVGDYRIRKFTIKKIAASALSDCARGIFCLNPGRRQWRSVLHRPRARHGAPAVRFSIFHSLINLKEYILDHNEKVERFGIDENLAKKNLIEAENSIDSLSKVNIPKSYDNSKSECKDEPPVKPNQFNGSSNSSSKSSNSSKGLRLSSFLNSFSVPKTNIKLILVILAIIILLLLFLWIKDIFPFEKNDSQVNDVPQTELVSDKNDEFETKTIDEESTKSKLGFAEPLEDLTKSVTDISEFNSIVENQNIIPVIGSLFDYNSTDISTNGKAVLTRFVNEYTNLEVPVKIIIEGFTCTIGSAEYNQILGEKRANNLKTQLIDLGVDENIIVIKPIGKQNFVSTNNGENDLILNRRSNVTIIRAD